MWGSACVRHFVEQGRCKPSDTSSPFAALAVHERGFRDYFAEVAQRTGVGHPDRDTYVSYFLEPAGRAPGLRRTHADHFLACTLICYRRLTK